MNTNILKKCIDKLKEDEPDIQYVLGMLETLYEMQPQPLGLASVIGLGVKTSASEIPKGSDVDEAAILDARAKAALEIIKETEPK